MKKKWILILSIILSVSLLFFGCSKAEEPTNVVDPTQESVEPSPDASKIKEEIVTMAIISTWDTLNIYNTTGNYGNAVADQMFERLVYRTHGGEILPRLGTTWEIADDYMSMTFNIVENATWHDGQEVTADDIVFTCKAMTDNKVNNYYRSAFNVLKGTDDDGVASNTEEIGADALDKYTVKFEFKEPKDPDTILNAFLSFLYVLPEHLLGEDIEKINGTEFWSNPVGAGPFKYVNDTAGETLELTANESYYKGEPSFRTLVVRVVPASNLTAGLINGDIDLVAMGSIPLSDWETVKNAPGINAASIVGYSYQYMEFNLSDENDNFKDPNVRIAIDKAINKKLIVDQLMLGEGEIAIGPMPPNHPYYNDKLVGNEYNPEEARQILKNTNFDLNKEYLMIVPQGNQVREQSALLIQQDLAAIGIKVKLETYDFPTLLELMREGKFDFGFLGGGSNIDPGESSVIVKPGDSRNYSLTTDPKWFDLAAKGAALTKPSERKVFYDQYQEALVEDQPYIWLYYQNSLWAYSDRLSNVPIEDFVWLNFGSWMWELK